MGQKDANPLGKTTGGWVYFFLLAIGFLGNYPVFLTHGQGCGIARSLVGLLMFCHFCSSKVTWVITIILSCSLQCFFMVKNCCT